MLKLIGIFSAVSFLLPYAKNTAAFIILFLLPIKSWTFWYMECLHMSLYKKLCTSKNGPVFLAHPV